MKKITISVIAILLLGLIFSSCTFVAGLYPTIGGTDWRFSTTIAGVGTISGTLFFGKRTNSFEEIHGNITLTAPFSAVKKFTGTLDRYDIKINQIDLGGNRAIRFDGELDNYTHSKLLAGSKIYYCANTAANPKVWQEGNWTGTMLSK